MAADNKEYMTILSTDISKAFDSLHPALMIQKLKAYSFSEASQNLMRSFFEHRRNRVKLQEADSAWKEQKKGAHKAPPSGLYSGTCSKMISHYIGSLLNHLCMQMTIKYTPVIMIY